jgi:Zn finger protein HypA/HybF involved in hydrogenase expression
MKSELLAKYPLLELEWDVIKNGPIPDNITLYSKIKYYFNCNRCNGKEYYISLKDWFRRKSHESKICRHYPANQVRSAKLKTSLAQHSPDLILEWSKNNIEDYNLLNYGSDKVVEWKCSKCNLFFNQKICNRTIYKIGCPYCTSKKVSLINSLESNYPELSRYLLHPFAYQVSSYSAKIGKWRCKKCDEVFNSRIYRVVNSYKDGKTGCPFCAGKRVNSRNNLLVTHPEICVEWDYSKNVKRPEEYTAGSGSRYKVWWICKNRGHSWSASINMRARSKGSDCPYCSHRISKVEIEWLNYLKIDEKYRQHKIYINGKRYLVDAYVPETNTIYEFWGDYYHGNPKIYNLDDYNKTCKKTFKELYSRTIEKEKIFRSNGYNFVFIWENEWIEINKKL